jgi:hypothetical protein
MILFVVPGQIIAEIMVLLADSSALPITLHDYIKDIRKEYNHFINEYGDDFHKANLSYGKTHYFYWQRIIIRLLSRIIFYIRC